VIPADVPPLFADAVVFVFGLVIGSFLNVCIYRLPRGESVVSPRSHCPGCGQPVSGYDNIPLFSYLILGGKCRRCHTRISPVYFFIELAAGLLFLFLYLELGPSLLFVKYAVFTSLLLVLVMTDWQTRLLPDRVTFPGMALGLVFSLLVPVDDGAGVLLTRMMGLEPPWRVTSLLDSVLGAVAGGGLLFGLAEAYYRLRRKEGLGLGDVKMMAMAGFFLGPKLVLLSIWFASVAGALLGGAFILMARRDWRAYEIPFGTFLGVAAFASALWGAAILRWYLGYLL
jgi:leader peptidase (prepilin peptidase)/N-methyltransferase